MAAETTTPDEPQPLTGGNTSVVVRLGDTVRRSAGPWTPAVHALLRHLRSVGMLDVPEVLGLDEAGREVLRFVPGEVGTLDEQAALAPWFRTVDAAHAIGDWLRRFHAAQRTFRPDPSLPWRRAPGRELGAGEVICHHDVSPYNTVRRPDGGVTVLDWDFARPGDPLEDLAWAAWRWVPLMAPGSAFLTAYGYDVDVGTQRERLAALLDGYAASRRDRSRVLDVVVDEQLRHADVLEQIAAEGDQAFVALCEQGYADAARQDAAWLRSGQLLPTLG